jgi:hypothetical protein
MIIDFRVVDCCGGVTYGMGAKRGLMHDEYRAVRAME